MKVSKINLSNFMTYKNVELEIPEQGVVLITGENGHGKSAIIEGVCAALWNETLRGTPWYVKGERSSAHVVMQNGDDIWEVERVCTPGGSYRIKVSGDGNCYDSASKAKSVIQAKTSTFDVWKRTHVFSSSDSTHFSRSTDAQKKGFMETILGLNRFELALKSCRKDKKTASAEHEAAKNTYNMYATKAQYEAEAVSVAQKTIDNLNENVPKPEIDESLDQLAKTLQMDREDLRMLKEDTSRMLYSMHHQALEAAESAKEIEVDKCPWCKQPIPESMKKELFEAAEKASAALEKIESKANKDMRRLMKQLTDVESQISEIRQKKAVQEAELKNYKSLQGERDRQQLIIQKASAANASYMLKKAQKRGKLEKIEHELNVIMACEKVLGLRGVRANITAQTLDGLEEIGNSWLSKFTDPIVRVEIKPYRVLKDKSIKDEWSMDVHGAGGGFGYNAASAGERQRIDIALLFASIEVAQAALSMQGGTMFFDEVFDHLDKPGVTAVISALEELATKRTVVVISHSDDFISSLKPTIHWHVNNGKVKVCGKYHR